MKKYRCASFFAGVGGIDLGFSLTGRYETVYANEYDPYPAATFEKNFQTKVDTRSIRDVEAREIPSFDVMLAGFPCQAFSVAGYREGFNDKKGRGDLYFELVRIYLERRPAVIFLENVKNLVGHDGGRTFRIITNELTEAGYTFRYAVLNACEYGNVPQNRERIYVVAFRDPEAAARFHFPMPVPLTRTLSDVIGFTEKQPEIYMYKEGKYKGDIYEKLKSAMDDPEAVYQWRRRYVRKNKSGVVPTLTANMGEGGHNVPLVLTPYGIRKLTPAECFRVQGFPESFRLPEDQSNARLYKQAGNSVCVSVIQRIADEIIKAL